MKFNRAMKTLLYANRAEPKSISVISILLLAVVGAITKLHCMYRECYIFAYNNNIQYLIYNNYEIRKYNNKNGVIQDIYIEYTR